MAKKKRKERLLEPLKSGEVINIAHKIRLEPNNVQKTYMNKAIGCARLAYNWALTEWKRAYGADEKPNAFKISKFVCPTCGFTIDRDTAAGINLKQAMERYLIGIDHPEFTLVERSSVDDRSLGYLRSTFSMKQEDSINLLKE